MTRSTPRSPAESVIRCRDECISCRERSQGRSINESRYKKILRLAVAASGGIGGHRALERQPDPEDRARAVGPVAGADRPALRLDEAAADREAKAGPGALPVA